MLGPQCEWAQEKEKTFSIFETLCSDWFMLAGTVGVKRENFPPYDDTFSKISLLIPRLLRGVYGPPVKALP